MGNQASSVATALAVFEVVPGAAGIELKRTVSADAEAVAVRYGRTIFDLRGDGDGPRIQPDGFRGAEGSVDEKELLPRSWNHDGLRHRRLGVEGLVLIFARNDAKTQT